MVYMLRDRAKVNKGNSYGGYESDHDFNRPTKRARTMGPRVNDQEGRPSTPRNNGEGTSQRAMVAAGNENDNAATEVIAGEGEGGQSIPSGTRRTILSWLTGLKKVKRNARVQYMNPATGEVAKEGRINRDGIKCDCCANMFTVWTFEEHAGGAHLQKPYYNIVEAATRKTLSDYLKEAWSAEKPEDEFGTRYSGSRQDDHDNACMVCADGGNLICCERCSSTCHLHCMNMEILPEDAWYCPYCICKFCGLCYGPQNEFLTCFQCEKKFHFTCSDGFSRNQQRESVVNDNANPLVVVFCSHGCQKIYEKLESLVGVKHRLRGTTLSWTLIRRMHKRAGVYIRDAHKRLECNSKIVLAWSVLNEGFQTSIDNLTSTNMIKNITFNRGFRSNYTRLNHSGFYTIILERHDEIISAATLRMHGTKLAEMPFISTRSSHRLKNMSRKLLSAVEFILRSMKIETLVIPSIPDVEGMWRIKYGFQMVGEDMMRELSQWNTLTIHSTIRLQKDMLSEAETKAIRGMENPATDNWDHDVRRQKPLVQALAAAPHGRIQYHGSSNTILYSSHIGASTSGTKPVQERAEIGNNNNNNGNAMASNNNRRPHLDFDLNRRWPDFDLNEPAPEANED